MTTERERAFVVAAPIGERGDIGLRPPPPPPPLQRRSIMSLADGFVAVEFPERIAPEDWEDIEAWVVVVMRTMRRFVKPVPGDRLPEPAPQ